MLAILYLFVMFLLGDAIGRRFYPFVSIPHRLASAFLVGLLICSWWTYALAYMFSNTASPMLWGNLFFFITSVVAILWLQRNPPKKQPDAMTDVSDAGFLRWDWVLAAVFLLFATWMMFRTFTMGDGNIMIGHHQFPDFGSTLSIMQSFALGHNFPTQYPHFTGERIRYHFLFYFQAGNLEFLGFNPAVANNILSIFSLGSLLVLVMALGSILFRSRVAGRIGAILFFFHGSLAFIPFLLSQESLAGLIDNLNKMTFYLKSGFPYRGEDWGVWSQNVFLNQRHLSSSIAIFVLVLIYLVMMFRRDSETVAEEAAAGHVTGDEIPFDADSEEPEDEDDGSEGPEDNSEEAGEDEGEEDEDEEDEDEEDEDEEDEDEDEEEEDDLDDEGSDEAEDDEEDDDNDEDEDDDDEYASESESDEVSDLRTSRARANAFDLKAFVRQNIVLVFSGLLLGLMPMWNGAIFLSAAVVLAGIFLLFPRRRKELLALAATTAIVALPQVIYLKTGHMKPVGYSMFRWGFVIDDAGIFDVLYYTFYTFGFKWVLLGIALYFANGMQRKLMAAVSLLLPLTYCFRFSEEVLANHKFINVWLVIVNVFCGFALVKLWGLKTGSTALPARILAVIFFLLVTIGGAIDLMPIKNSYFINMKYDDDKLIEWVKNSTDPSSIFLSHRYINHQILLAGRRLFYGDPYYAWGSDYDTPEREVIVRRIFEATDPQEAYRLLKENHINYVAIDDQIRNVRQFIKNPNEDLFANNFPLVFEDPTGEYGHIKIYKIPDEWTPMALNQPAAAPPGANAFTGGEGLLPGQFSKPRGVAVDPKGFIYFADTMNARVQKFDSTGKFISAFGTLGDGPGQLKEPNGVTVDPAGDIYVTDALNHKLVKYDGEGTFIKEWKNPEVGFYGPRDLTFGPNGTLYIIDQGHTRIAMFDPKKETFTMWGSQGAGEGQFHESTGICVADKDIVVTDTGNNRIQIFDLAGTFVRQWPVPEWQNEQHHFPDCVYDTIAKRLYVSSGKSDEVLAYDLEGKSEPGFKPTGPDALDWPSSLAILNADGKRYLIVLNTNSAKLSRIELEPAKAGPDKKETKPAKR